VQVRDEGELAGGEICRKWNPPGGGDAAPANRSIPPSGSASSSDLRQHLLESRCPKKSRLMGKLEKGVRNYDPKGKNQVLSNRGE